MRKITFFLSLISLLLININSGFKKAQAASFEATYTSGVYGPFEANSHFQVTGKVKVTNGYNHNNLRLRYELFSPLKDNLNRAYASGYVGSKFSYPQTKEISYSFDFYDRYNYARTYILVRFGIYDLTNKKYLNYVEGKVENKKSIVIEEPINREYLFEPCLRLTNERLYERFVFNNFTNHLLDLNTYYRLDLASLSFEYDFIRSFTYESISLTFKDPHNLFPYIEEEDEVKRIPLYIKEDNKVISLYFKNLHVNPDTLEMSLSSRSGFTSTNYFYLPKNKLNELQGSKFTLDMVNIGASNISINYIFEASFESLLLGPCNVSEFCVVGGINK